MKKIISFIIAAICFTSLFAETCDDYFKKALAYEEEKNWVLALDAYYDAIITDEPVQNRQEAYQKFNNLKKEIMSGKPGYGEFDEFDLHDEWKNLLIQMEKYAYTRVPYIITTGELERGDLNYKTKTASYNCNVNINYSQRFRIIKEIIVRGFRIVRKSDWDDIPVSWPEYSAFYKGDSVFNDEGIVMAESINENLAYNPFVLNLGYFDYQISIVDENGNILSNEKTFSSTKEQIIIEEYIDENGNSVSYFNDIDNKKGKVSFEEISRENMKLIDSKKAHVVVDEVSLHYGKSDDEKIFTYAADQLESMADDSVSFVEKIDDFVKLHFIDNIVMKEIPGLNLLAGETEVTQSLYEKIMGSNPSHFKHSSKPVERISWYDAIYFCNKLSEYCGLEPVYAIDAEELIFNTEKWNYQPHTQSYIQERIVQVTEHNGFRLPTNEEWEYAAKGGEDYTYAGSDNLYDVAWYNDKNGGGTHIVADKKPNGYGLYDMLGNVWEWCWDEEGTKRDNKGGGWFSKSSNVQIMLRDGGNAPTFTNDNLGMRLFRAMNDE